MIVDAAEEGEEYRAQRRVQFTAYVVRRMRWARARERLAGFRHVATWTMDGARVRLLVPREVDA